MMVNHELFKKELQKAMKGIRELHFPTGSYPKAMMTGQQIEKKTATVNCGGEWKKAEYTKVVAETVLNDRNFRAICAYYEVGYQIEYNKAVDSYQVRLNW